MCEIDDGEVISARNTKATGKEANYHILLGDHSSIAKCLFVDPAKSFMNLEYYPNGTLQDYVDKFQPSFSEEHPKRWACQLIREPGSLMLWESGIRTSDSVNGY